MQLVIQREKRFNCEGRELHGLVHNRKLRVSDVDDLSTVVTA